MKSKMENIIDPELLKAFKESPELDIDNLEVTRENIDEIFKNAMKKDPNVIVSERFIPSSEGDSVIRILIYQPKNSQDKLPALLFIHGGGYVTGKPEMNSDMCQNFVKGANCVVVSVDYRLAPEHPYPLPNEDCYSALTWMVDNSEELNIDTTRIGVAGQSAGGGLTASISLMARDRKGPKLLFQMPLYPMIDDTNTTPSSYEITDKRVWNREANIKSWNMYLAPNQNGILPKYAAPTRENDLSNLPPTYTFV